MVYLDNGIAAVVGSIEEEKASIMVQHDLAEAGFAVNTAKSK